MKVPLNFTSALKQQVAVLESVDFRARALHDDVAWFLNRTDSEDIVGSKARIKEVLEIKVIPADPEYSKQVSLNWEVIEFTEETLDI